MALHPADANSDIPFRRCHTQLPQEYQSTGGHMDQTVVLALMLPGDATLQILSAA